MTFSYCSPRYWGTWLTILMFRLMAATPLNLQPALARVLTATASLFSGKRRHIITTNLRLCFPEWDEKTRQQKTRETLYHNIYGFIEAANAYYRDVETYRARVDVIGLDILNEAHAQGRGVILVGAHYSHLDLGGALVSLFCEPHAIYRPHNNPLMDQFILQGRARFMKSVIRRDDMRGIVKALKKNEIVWYPPDQDYGRQHSVFAPFFGVNAATITATSRLVKFNQSPLVMLSYRRDDSTDRYTVEFSEPPVAFPSGDDVTDATLINAALEMCIRKAPTQYMWTHRRFKTQPDSKGLLYRKSQ